jgi:quercetin dioxygenase-like cupin family protein
MRRLAPIICVIAALGTSIAGAARHRQTPQMPIGITRTQLADNQTVLVARLKLEPGAREIPHTHPFSAVVIQIVPGEVEMTLGADHTREHRGRGHVQYIPREVTHAAANVGAAPFDVVTIAIKPDRKAPASVPVSASPEGIVRTPVLENDEVRVTDVKFSPGAREPEHTHPYDLVLVALSGGKVELHLGNTRELEDRQPGFVWFLPRDVTHAAASAAPGPVEFLSVGIK